MSDPLTFWTTTNGAHHDLSRFRLRFASRTISILSGMDEKTCTKCQLPKPIDNFTKRKDSKDGLGSWCKNCGNAYRRDKGYNRYESRRDEYTENQRKFRKTDKYWAYESEYRAKYKASSHGVVTDLLSRARSRAKQSKMEFELDREWVTEHLESMKCEASGVDLVLETDATVAHTAFKPSIDRIDNGKGYLKSNSRIVCVLYNKAKSDYTDEDVLKLASALIHKQQLS